MSAEQLNSTTLHSLSLVFHMIRFGLLCRIFAGVLTDTFHQYSILFSTEMNSLPHLLFDIIFTIKLADSQP